MLGYILDLEPVEANFEISYAAPVVHLHPDLQALGGDSEDDSSDDNDDYEGGEFMCPSVCQCIVLSCMWSTQWYCFVKIQWYFVFFF